LLRSCAPTGKRAVLPEQFPPRTFPSHFPLVADIHPARLELELGLGVGLLACVVDKEQEGQEEQEGFAQTAKVRCQGAPHPLLLLFEPATVVRLPLASIRPKIRMPAVVVTGPTVTQNSLFLS